MIPAALLGVAPSLDPARRARVREALRERLGSEWWELVLHGALALPERWAGPPHGAPSRWDWGVTLRSLAEAEQRREHLDRLARNMTPEQHAQLWQDPSPRAAELRRFMRAG